MVPSTTDGEFDGAHDPSVDTVFDILSERRRRVVLRYMADESDGVAGFDDLLEYVLENDPTTGPEDRETVAIDLDHRHLAKIDDGGVIEYDRENGTVRYRESPFVENCLDLVSNRDPA